MEALLGTLFLIGLPIYWGILLILGHLDKRDARRRYQEERKQRMRDHIVWDYKEDEDADC